MTTKNTLLIIFILMFAVAVPAYALQGVEVSGDLALSGTGGLVFPDGTVQTTSSVPTWSQALSANRFVPVLSGNGQLDNETGIVWATTPDSTLRNWAVAIDYCYGSNLGGRGGWRLPSIADLRSLIGAGLPGGHPFTIVQSPTSQFWAYTVDDVNPTAGAWAVIIGTGVPFKDSKSSSYYAWCMRAGL